MFEAFAAKLTRDRSDRGEGSESAPVPDVLGLSDFFSEFGGSSFEGGLYRVMFPSDLAHWKERVDLAFPDFEQRVVCFAFDWAGRVFALDTERLEDGQAGVILFEPGTGEALRIPANLQTFHDRELLQFGEAALGISFYTEWLGSGGAAPSFDQCVGYRRPLFLGGADEVGNLEVSDLDVYWHMMGQLIEQTRGLPPGTPVHISFD
jgi:hypothetical protein